MRRISWLFSVCLFLIPFTAHAIETAAKQAILIDADTRTVLLEKNSQEKMPTSSMSKVLTAYMVFEAIKDGRVKMDQALPVSERAWRMQGSKMFVPLGAQVTIQELLQGVIVQSGNDATVVLAEGVGGSEEAFADSMNKKAQQLGMRNSHFMNASGWPDPNHYSTAYDLAILTYSLIRDFPEQYHFYSQKDFTYNGIKQGNRNPLLYRKIGADGVKTGHTEEAGYGLIGSAVQDNRRLILVVNGLSSMQERADEAASLLSWGFANFKHIDLFKAGETIENASVWMGIKSSVPVIVKENVRGIYKIDEKEKLKITAVINEPVQAPVKKDTQVGILKIKMGDFPERQVALYAAEDVGEMGWMQRIVERAKLMVGGDGK